MRYPFLRIGGVPPRYDLGGCTSRSKTASRPVPPSRRHHRRGPRMPGRVLPPNCPTPRWRRPRWNRRPHAIAYRHNLRSSVAFFSQRDHGHSSLQIHTEGIHSASPWFQPRTAVRGTGAASLPASAASSRTRSRTCSKPPKIGFIRQRQSRPAAIKRVNRPGTARVGIAWPG